MRRVAVTGLGCDHADRPRCAVDLAGRGRRRERHRLHPGLRRERVPGPDRRRGEGLRPVVGRAAEGGAPDGPERAARARGGAGGVARRRRSTGSIRLASASSSARRSAACRGSSEQQRRPARARAGSRLALLHPQRPRRLGERPDRDLARTPRAELRARCRRARRARMPSARAPSSSGEATPTRCSPVAPSRASTR